MWKLFFAVFVAVLALGSGGLVGASKEIDVNDEGALNALNFAVVKHNQGSNDMFLSQPAQVLSVRRQVVGGLKYFITVQMAKTPCRKDSVNEVCAIPQDLAMAKPYQCVFEVWTRPWANEITVLKETC